MSNSDVCTVRNYHVFQFGLMTMQQCVGSSGRLTMLPIVVERVACHRACLFVLTVSLLLTIQDTTSICSGAKPAGRVTVVMPVS